MRISDRVQATLMHATARWTVSYGEQLRFAGSDLPDPEVVRVDTAHGRVPVHVYGTGTTAHVHLHGGAWLMRYPQMDDWWCRYLAATTGAAVLNVDFRTGPHVAYPVAQEQAHAVAAWAAGRYERVSVGGFSSGGGMAAAVALMARDRGSFTPVLQVLGIPALDMAAEGPAGAGMISPALRGLVRRVYFPDVASRREPYASPLLAPDLTGLPPALVLTAERDTLRPDGVRYVERLRAAGVDVWHHETSGVDHYFLTEDPVRARDTMSQVADRVRAALAGAA
jgi:acetyl esterase